MPYTDPNKAKANRCARKDKISMQRKIKYQENIEQMRAQRNKYYKQNAITIIDRQKKARQTSLGWARNTLSRLKARATAINIGFSLELSDLLQQPSHCPVFAFPLEFSSGTPSAYSVDRIDNTKGYHTNNITIMSDRANRLKRDATLDELILLGLWATKIKEKLNATNEQTTAA